MKRYEIRSNSNSVTGASLFESDTGSWVWHADARAAIEQARREAFEEAAQIAASYGAPVVPVVQRVTARDIAAAIRARGEGK